MAKVVANNVGTTPTIVSHSPSLRGPPSRMRCPIGSVVGKTWAGADPWREVVELRLEMLGHLLDDVRLVLRVQSCPRDP